MAAREAAKPDALAGSGAEPRRLPDSTRNASVPSRHRSCLPGGGQARVRISYNS
jgi:hypothetical protein